LKVLSAMMRYQTCQDPQESKHFALVIELYFIGILYTLTTILLLDT
jgi:hypothetical protein